MVALIDRGLFITSNKESIADGSRLMQPLKNIIKNLALSIIYSLP